jgi:hypothetical protein
VPRGIPDAGQKRQLPKLEGAERQRITKAMRKDYEHGLTLRQVAAKYGRSIGGTRALLLEAGTVMRPNPSGPRAS